MKKYIWPLVGDFGISQYFGENPPWYKKYGYKGHMGIDIACPVGTPVIASCWGTVKTVATDPTGWGIFIVISHDEIDTQYNHLSEVNVVQGCYVTQGQQIGRSGKSGNVTGPHLDFDTIERNNMQNGYKGCVDPFIYLNKEYPEPPQAKTTEEIELKENSDIQSEEQKKTIDNIETKADNKGIDIVEVNRGDRPLSPSKFISVISNLLKLLIHFSTYLSTKKSNKKE